MRPYDERLDHLLARAARVFADKGYHPTTMRDLSAASGMSLAGMYYYVRGKEDLLALIQERCFTRVLEGARQAIAKAADPQERLQAFIKHHVAFFAQHMAEMTEPQVKALVQYRTEDGLAILELDDPPANTYTYEMMRQLDEAILKARFDDNVHVIVIRGRGDKFFSAGANIGMLNTVTPRFKYFFCLHANETLNRLEQTPKLTIAALNRHTVGGRLEIAMACHVRLAKENAGKIGLPEVNLGVLPGTGGTQRVARILGKPLSIELMVKGELFSFDRAKEIGLVNEIFPAKDFWEQVVLYAKQFCPPHKASKAVGLIKRSVQSGAEVPFESALAIERELQQQLFQSEDAKEGIAANQEKRVAEFKGK